MTSNELIMINFLVYKIVIKFQVLKKHNTNNLVLTAKKF